jgi:flagellar hook-associated protein 1
MSLLNIMSIGTTALLTSKNALSTVANNIANASTTGYTRQSVVLSSLAAGSTTTIGESGRGVTISDVVRLYDSFTTLQLRTEKSNLAYWDTYADISSTIENIFDETSDTGISTAISDFFNSWQSVADNAQGSTERTSLLDSADYLSSRIGSAYDALNDERTALYESSQDLVTEVNSITDQISALNTKILQSPGALDLEDQRDLLVENLNEILSVDTVENSDGTYSILLGGTSLVSPAGSSDMSVSVDSNNNMQFEVTTNGSSVNVNDQISGGKLQANLDGRDTTIVEYMNSLNAFAINLSDQVNYYHSQGIDLNGDAGGDFFNSLVDITDSSTGGGTVSSVTVTDVSDYGEGINNIYSIDYNTTGGTGYQQEGTSGIYWRVRQSSDDGATWTDVATTDVTLSVDSSTTPAYRTISFGGFTARIDGTQATLTSAGSETFQIEPDRNAATNMGVAITDEDKIAAASDATLLPGDNTNAETIADLVNQSIIAGKTPVTFYSDIVALSGANADTANTYVDFETTMVSSLETTRSATSGVSLEEEGVSLIQYQKAFEAASKLITVGSELLDTLIEMV